MTELSPAAYAVLDAHDIGFSTPAIRVAAALRAAADELIPRLPGDTAFQRGYLAGIDNARHQLRAIAAELEGK